MKINFPIHPIWGRFLDDYADIIKIQTEMQEFKSELERAGLRVYAVRGPLSSALLGQKVETWHWKTLPEAQPVEEKVAQVKRFRAEHQEDSPDDVVLVCAYAESQRVGFEVVLHPTGWRPTEEDDGIILFTDCAKA